MAKTSTTTKKSENKTPSKKVGGSGDNKPRKPTGPALEAGALDKGVSETNVQNKSQTPMEETPMSKKEVISAEVVTVVEAPVRATMKSVLPDAVGTRLPGIVGNTLDKVPARYGIPAILLIAGLFILRKLAQEDTDVVVEQPASDPAIKA